MAMDLLLKTTSVLEEKNLQEADKDVEEIIEIEGRTAMDGESLQLPSSNRRDSNVSNLGLRGNDKAFNDSNMKIASENPKEFTPIDKVAQLESTKSEMGEVREENERLKTILTRIMNDYKALQMHFFEIVHQEESTKKSLEISASAAATTNSDEETEETELVSLSLGSSSTSLIPKKHDYKANSIETNNSNSDICININGNSNVKEGDESPKTGLSLGLDCKFYQNHGNSPDNGFEEAKVDEVTKRWPPNKVVKEEGGTEDEPAHVKKARVTVRARCDTPTMQDGCQWRKYGQKIAKGNPCPRAYYRCTVAPGCGVRKQVQRCAEDMSILITTYEGTHNHPLPLQATAMASTTAAAASMLMSGSSIPVAGPSATSGLTFDLFDNSGISPFYITNPAMSTSPAYPTITLDLTSTPSAPQFTRLSSAFSTAPRYSSSLGVSNFNFSTDQSTLSSSWNSSTNTNTSYFNYGSHQFNKNPIVSSTLAKPPHEQFYQNFSQKPNPSSTPSSSMSVSSSSSSSKQNFSNTIAAATKAIASDPSFQSVLAAAITSIVSTNNTVGAAGEVNGRNVGQNFKWGEQIPSSTSSMSAYWSRGDRGMPSFLNETISIPSENTQQGNLLFHLAPPLPFSSAKSSSASPANDISREHNS